MTDRTPAEQAAEALRQALDDDQSDIRHDVRYAMHKALATLTAEAARVGQSSAGFKDALRQVGWLGDDKSASARDPDEIIGDAIAKANPAKWEDVPSRTPEIDWDDPGVEHGYVPISPTEKGGDSNNAATSVGPDKSAPALGSGPERAVSPDREALSRHIDRLRDDLARFSATRELTGFEITASTVADACDDLIRAPAQAEVEAMAMRLEAVASLIWEANREWPSVTIRKAAALLRRLSSPVGEWRPIASAPKDGTPILVFRPQFEEFPAMVGEDIWHAGEWWKSRKGQQPTFWQPLPAPPQEKPNGHEE